MPTFSKGCHKDLVKFTYIFKSDYCIVNTINISYQYYCLRNHNFLFQLQPIFQFSLLNTKSPAAKEKTNLQLDFPSEEHCYELTHPRLT